ncbi:MAG: ERAP1-like C-terminal domain-containing protein [Planctomycetes bacterium]|nr:ERAP1-like C-terminal domain-containing protein [Planctomycetota bacterium]
MERKLSGCALALAMALPQDPEPGIALRMAVARVAQVRDLRYEVEFDLRRTDGAIPGRATIAFVTPDPAAGRDLVLDFGGTALHALSVDGTPRAVRAVHDHVVLDGAWLAAGPHRVTAEFTAAAAPSGAPVIEARDPGDGSRVLYSLLVPADAHRLFPCFDQPDLKARFTLTLHLPAGWTAVANGAERGAPEPAAGGGTTWRFAETQPISTYLFAFAAGTLQAVSAPVAAGDAGPALRVLVRPSRIKDLEADTLFALHRAALRWLRERTAAEYPFGKLDFVLLPAFPYNGMEHAGAIFYREGSLVFERAPTRAERTRRSLLIHHEVAHQWFGNLVTMAWFDDLWLKEGFATYASYRILADLEPQARPWVRFLQGVKPPALAVDATPGTLAIHQELRNLDDAKSNYGPIVYNKAPALLRELERRLGVQAFDAGVRRFVARHAFGNARWQDLITALQEGTSEDLTAWSDAWIRSPGAPLVRVGRSATGVALRQEPSATRSAPWPLRITLQPLAGTDPAPPPARLDSGAVQVDVPGPTRPWLANGDDAAYARFLPEPALLPEVLARTPALQDPLLRAAAVSQVHEAVREGELDPLRFAELLLDLLPAEDDPESAAWLLGMLQTTLQRWLAPGRGEGLHARATAWLHGVLREGPLELRLAAFRALVRLSTSPQTLELCARVAHGGDTLGLPRLGAEERFLAFAALVAQGRDTPEGWQAMAKSVQRDAERHLFLAGAARPESRGKERYFGLYLQEKEPPENWVQESLALFHWPGQEALTLPFLRRALDRVLWVKEHRKIFFLPAWIDAFVNAHSSAEALGIVESFLAETRDLPEDVRRKVLQSQDALRRAVAIRARWHR